MMQSVSRHALILPLVDDKFILFNGLYGAGIRSSVKPRSTI